ncbi:hypothetical protein PoB_007139700 [Plakobranchus ocellatus]|uniref:Uncharacterized protein n=1 Tax=Plakobranchus ocellatus TaxID=259542 RepID=A0AAV4DKT6_9GAST|nr:hypothetical protein PoB_007139700 [Plakobranchus ocellatus]
MTSGFNALRQGLEPVTEGSLQISGRTHKPLFTDASGIEVHVNHELSTQEFKVRVIRTKKHRNREQATENSEIVILENRNYLGKYKSGHDDFWLSADDMTAADCAAKDQSESHYVTGIPPDDDHGSENVRACPAFLSNV